MALATTGTSEPLRTRPDTTHESEAHQARI